MQTPRPFYFWQKAWLCDPKLFLLFLLFVVGQIFFTYKGVETLPFFNYGMYSAPLAKAETIEHYRLIINQKDSFRLYELPFGNQVYIEYQIKHYLRQEEGDTKAAFGPWLKSYIEACGAVGIESLQLEYAQHQALAPYALIESHVQPLYPVP